jgi:hypothetical protein
MVATMSNPAKRKGSSFERLICDYLGETVPCERIPAGSELDRGDLWTPHAAIQCKNRAQLSLGAWLDDTVAQQANAHKPYHWLVVKRRGSADPANQFAICTVEQLRRILDDLND